MSRSMRTAAEMFPLVEAYRGRELTKKAFCAQHGMPESVLTYWIAKYHREQATEAGSFVEISPSLPMAERALMEMIFPNGIRLRLFSAAMPPNLERLLTLTRPVA